jgi:hypothetical protein
LGYRVIVDVAAKHAPNNEFSWAKKPGASVAVHLLSQVSWGFFSSLLLHQKQ